MNATLFESLCGQAAASLNLSDPTPLSKGELVHTNEVWLSARPVEQPFDGVAFVMDVGPLPTLHREAVLEAVLSQQTAWMGDVCGHFHLSDDGRRLLFAAAVPCEAEVSGEDLATTIRAWCDVVRAWRQVQLPLEVTT
jgi:hypothetical protein